MAKAKLKKQQEADVAAFLKRVAKLPAVERRNLLLGLRDPTGRAKAMLAKAVGEIRRIARRACSVNVLDATIESGEAFVVVGRARTDFGSRIGDAEGVRPTRRLVPPAARSLEDRYDGMTTFEATVCADPPSVTGLQFQQLEHMKGREREQRRIKRGASKKSKKARENRVGDSPKAA
jgi:hypothetical protein